MKYHKTEINSEKVKIILNNENNIGTKVCINNDYYSELFINLPDCKNYVDIPSNSEIIVNIKNPYNQLRYLKSVNSNNDNQNDFYTILKPDSKIKYTYVYSQKTESLIPNNTYDIMKSGEFNYELKQNSFKKEFILLQINKFNDNIPSFAFGSQTYKELNLSFY